MKQLSGSIIINANGLSDESFRNIEALLVSLDEEVELDEYSYNEEKEYAFIFNKEKNQEIPEQKILNILHDLSVNHIEHIKRLNLYYWDRWDYNRGDNTLIFNYLDGYHNRIIMSRKRVLSHDTIIV